MAAEASGGNGGVGSGGSRPDRITLLREAAGGPLACERRFGADVVCRHVNGLSATAFEGLCRSFRGARANTKLRDCLSHMAIYALTTLVLALSAPRIGASWLHVLMVICAALLLVSFCLDVITYERLVRRNLLMLHLRVDELLIHGEKFSTAVREFEGGLGGSR